MAKTRVRSPSSESTSTRPRQLAAARAAAVASAALSGQLAFGAAVAEGAAPTTAIELEDSRNATKMDMQERARSRTNATVFPVKPQWMGWRSAPAERLIGTVGTG
ncbi:hypothetical protein Ato02nite_075440 [Paractinoplanes toevensis]|uniref:Uncharacterized protein n=1 Tax=Paractinoplanes toevensis TaxID=571911 RepID=A0A919W8V9_9ACTN|nr:hypothetical protein Ato02nite_075440 [Actinoplanes toevensis]